MAIESKLLELDDLKQAIIEEIGEMLASLRQRRVDLTADLDRDIALCVQKLRDLGVYVGNESEFNNVAEEIRRFLESNTNRWIGASEIRRVVKTFGVIAIILRSYIDKGIIEYQGERRGRVYRIRK